MRIPANPLRMSASQPAVTRLPPGLGQQSAEILCECGFDSAAVTRLTSAGGVCAPD